MRGAEVELPEGAGEAPLSSPTGVRGFPAAGVVVVAAGGVVDVATGREAGVLVVVGVAVEVVVVVEVLAGVTTGEAGEPPPVAVAAPVDWVVAAGWAGAGGVAGPRRGLDTLGPLLFGVPGPAPPLAPPLITQPTASKDPAAKAARYVDLMNELLFEWRHG